MAREKFMNSSEQARYAASLLGQASQIVDPDKLREKILEDEVLFRLKTVDNLLRILTNDMLQMANDWEEEL